VPLPVAASTIDAEDARSLSDTDVDLSDDNSDGAMHMDEDNDGEAVFPAHGAYGICPGQVPIMITSETVRPPPPPSGRHASASVCPHPLCSAGYRTHASPWRSCR
jgi:hypothetical protein